MKGRKILILGGLLLLLLGGNVNAKEQETQTAVKYIKTTTYPGGAVVNEEITEEEYNAMPDEKPQLRNTIETNAKVLTLTLSNEGGGDYFAKLMTHWKYIPTVKSYDINAMRFSCFNTNYGSRTNGKQMYDNSVITYSNGGTNMNKFSNGFGISMNIVDSVSSSLDTTINTPIHKSSACTTGKVYATYQHATTNVSLATSKSYTISSSGVGSVVDFYNSTIQGYYDSTPGLSITAVF